ncbi:hypothetical protein [Endozoicomonas sp. ONNA1]|uniref:hypothetical protein n=1 Tax=Endozoicomonas sp. ONNA1 TaxID=2828740 RepID=UPI002147AD57|nr:hypothetical protein [Endozoicomonas sp. ONNA1]
MISSEYEGFLSRINEMTAYWVRISGWDPHDKTSSSALINLAGLLGSDQFRFCFVSWGGNPDKLWDSVRQQGMEETALLLDYTGYLFGMICCNSDESDYLVDQVVRYIEVHRSQGLSAINGDILERIYSTDKEQTKYIIENNRWIVALFHLSNYVKNQVILNVLEN